MTRNIGWKKIVAMILAVAMSLSVYGDVAWAAEPAYESIDGGQTSPKSAVPTEDDRYTVLVLDTSASSSFTVNGEDIYVADTAVEYVKTAAQKFIENIQSADRINHVAVVEYKGEGANIVSPFSTDTEELSGAIDGLYEAEGVRSIAEGLRTAKGLLDEVTDPDAVKDVVLFTTGMTNQGDYSYEGHYDESTPGSGWKRTNTGIHLYAYANCAYEAAEELKEDAYLYSIGLFQTLEGMPAVGRELVNFFKMSASDLATSSEYFYDVQDPEDIQFVFGEIAKQFTKKKISFSYASGDDRDYTARCYYTDQYFFKDSCGKKQLDGYNKSLSTASLCLALSAFGSNQGGDSDYSNKYRNVEKFLKDLDFKDFDKNDWFSKKPQSDSIGAAAAYKILNIEGEDCALIALAVRGGGYESEWAGNFTIGKTGQHYGFSKAKSQVLAFLKSYISENQISGRIKLWLTGYSRAAATANLVAGALDDGESLGDGVVLAKEDLYAYCFETPMGALKSEISNRLDYNNIYNIVNKNDPVTKVAMSALNFTRFGGDYFLPDRITDGNGYKNKMNKMLKYYNKMASKEETGDYAVDDFVMKKIDLRYIAPGGKSPIQNDEKNKAVQSEYLDTTINKLTKERIKTRDNYVQEFQNGIRIIFTARYGTLFPDCPAQRVSKFFSLFLDKLCSMDTLGKIAAAAVNPHPDAKVTKVVEDIMEEALNEAGINNYSPSALKKFAEAVVELVLVFVVSHPNLTITGICNVKTLGAAHYPELCLAWLMSQDNNYEKKTEEADGNGNYRVIRINCPIDVNVYDREGNRVAAIIEDTPLEIPESSIVSKLNEDGEKIIYLPANGDYELELSATGDGIMHYSVNEFSSTEGDITRIINYRGITLTEGAAFHATVPAYDSEEQNNEILFSSTDYELQDENGDWIFADEDLKGEEARNAYHMVTVSADDKSHGVVSGQGIRQKGSFAQVEAAAYEGYRFTGWYESGKLVSRDASYRFCVEKDRSFTAKFEPVKGKVSRITISGISKKIAAGKKITLTAKVYQENAANRKVIWKTSKKKYASVNQNGKVVLKKAGIGKKVTITASAADGSGVKAVYKIKIMKHAVKRIRLKLSSHSIKAGKKQKIKAIVSATGKKANKKLKWSSSNEKYAVVNQKGYVKTTKAGKGKSVIITAMSTDGSSKKARIRLKIK